MIRSIFQYGFSSELIIDYLLLIPIILISLSLHELSHGYIAYRCGDPTARNLGRLTMNPLKHLDPIGAIMMLLFGFGWAVPVPINTRNFKNYKRDLALVALAGPVSNILLAVISIFFMFLFGKIADVNLIFQNGFLFYNSEISKLTLVIITFFYTFATLNIGLALFNLIPLPPLDGSRIITSILPRKLLNGYFKIEQHSRMIFIIVMLSTYVPLPIGPFDSLGDMIFWPLQFARNGLINGIIWLVSLIF